MPNEFRFLVICEAAHRREEDGYVTLNGVVDEISGSASGKTELQAVVGAILLPHMKGKPLDLMAWRLDENGERQPAGGYVGTPLILPDGKGATTLPYTVDLPTPATGVYGFELFDRKGVFGAPEKLLATYMFGVTVR